MNTHMAWWNEEWVVGSGDGLGGNDYISGISNISVLDDKFIDNWMYATTLTTYNDDDTALLYMETMIDEKLNGEQQFVSTEVHGFLHDDYAGQSTLIATDGEEKFMVYNWIKTHDDQVDLWTDINYNGDAQLNMFASAVMRDDEEFHGSTQLNITSEEWFEATVKAESGTAKDAPGFDTMGAIFSMQCKDVNDGDSVGLMASARATNDDNKDTAYYTSLHYSFGGTEEWSMYGGAKYSDHNEDDAVASIKVISGACYTSSDGRCLYSPNYPNNYGNYENCQASVHGSGTLSAVAFETESRYDYLYIDSAEFDGSDGPTNVPVDSSSLLRFTSDGSLTHSGFEVCIEQVSVGYDNDCAADYSTWSATCAAAQADPSNQQAGMDCCVQAKEYAEKDCNCDGSCDSQCSGMLEQVKGVCDGVGLGFELTTCSQVGYDNDCAADYSTWSATCAAAQADPSNQQAGMDCCVQAIEYAEKDCNCDGSCDSQCSGMLEQVKGVCDDVGLGFELTTCSQGVDFCVHYDCEHAHLPSYGSELLNPAYNNAFDVFFKFLENDRMKSVLDMNYTFSMTDDLDVPANFTVDLIKVISGACYTSSDGRCLYSPNYPNNYGNYENCQASVHGSGTLSAVAFETESRYDYLYIDSAEFDGSDGPTNVPVDSSSLLRFTSDGSETHSGFEVCIEQVSGINSDELKMSFAVEQGDFGFAAVHALWMTENGVFALFNSSDADGDTSDVHVSTEYSPFMDLELLAHWPDLVDGDTAISGEMRISYEVEPWFETNSSIFISVRDDQYYYNSFDDYSGVATMTAYVWCDSETEISIAWNGTTTDDDTASTALDVLHYGDAWLKANGSILTTSVDHDDLDTLALSVYAMHKDTTEVIVTWNGSSANDAVSMALDVIYDGDSWMVANGSVLTTSTDLHNSNTVAISAYGMHNNETEIIVAWNGSSANDAVSMALDVIYDGDSWMVANGSVLTTSTDLHNSNTVAISAYGMHNNETEIIVAWNGSSCNDAVRMALDIIYDHDSLLVANGSVLTSTVTENGYDGSSDDTNTVAMTAYVRYDSEAEVGVAWNGTSSDDLVSSALNLNVIYDNESLLVTDTAVSIITPDDGSPDPDTMAVNAHIIYDNDTEIAVAWSGASTADAVGMALDVVYDGSSWLFGNGTIMTTSAADPDDLNTAAVTFYALYDDETEVVMMWNGSLSNDAVSTVLDIVYDRESWLVVNGSVTTSDDKYYESGNEVQNSSAVVAAYFMYEDDVEMWLNGIGYVIDTTGESAILATSTVNSDNKEWGHFDLTTKSTTYGDGMLGNMTAISRIDGDHFVDVYGYGWYNTDGVTLDLDVDHDSSHYMHHKTALRIWDEESITAISIKEADLTSFFIYKEDEILSCNFSGTIREEQNPEEDRYAIDMRIAYREDEVVRLLSEAYNIQDMTQIGGSVTMTIDRTDAIAVVVAMQTEDSNDSDTDLKLLMRADYQNKPVIQLDMGIPDAYFPSPPPSPPCAPPFTPPPPSPSPPPPFLAVTTVITRLVDQDIAAFKDQTFEADFITAYTNELAASANVEPTYVTVTSIVAGSVVVNSEIIFISSVQDAEDFEAKVKEDSASIFSEEFTSAYGTSTVVETTTALLVSPPPDTAVSPPTTEDSESTNSAGTELVTIVGGALGGGVALAMIMGTAYYLYGLKKKTRQADTLHKEHHQDIEEGAIVVVTDADTLNHTEVENPLHLEYHPDNCYYSNSARDLKR
ncbi:hypothetical protein CYMTET_56136 [Cymbomonas tetramitiformis]|uniref:CUB domain-containing protein n=1 Tax=Cymbomonas tetramitiformis TaxID=36881 RepID=A0AAE0BBI7_9CHLO|nr:hypothetical protein CYMTET_56136 [Cymbomonas tetramitiformis]